MGFHPGDDRSSDSGGHRHHRILVGLNQPLIECARSQWAATCGRTLLPARFNVDPRRTSGLSGLSRGGRPSLARVLWSGLTQAGPGWLGASGAGAHGGPRRRRRVVGAPMVLKDQRTPVAAGPAPCVGCARSTAPSAGARGGHPTTAAPKLHRGTSIVKEHRTAACLVGPSCNTHSSSGLRGPHIFMGTTGPSERWRPDLRGRSGRKAQEGSKPLAPRSALPHCGLTRPPAADSPASGLRQTAPRSA